MPSQAARHLFIELENISMNISKLHGLALLALNMAPVAISTAAGAGKTGRFTVEIRVEDAQDCGNTRISEYYRYLSYVGYEGCPTDIHIRIDKNGSGATADVQGMAPFTHKEQADSRGTDLDRKMQCLSRTTVYDTCERRIYTDGFGVPAVRGLYLHAERGRPEVRNPDAEVSGSREALERVSRQLRAAPASGTLTTTMAGGRNNRWPVALRRAPGSVVS